MSKKKRMVKSRLGAPPLPAQSDLVDLLQHYEAGNFSKAEENALLITRLFPEHSFAWKVLAAIFNHSGRQNEALIANQRAVKAAPNDLEARSNLAAMLQNVGRLEEAETQLRKVLAAKPSFTQAHNNLGLILHELKRFDEAEASFLRAIGLDSNYAEAYNNLSVTLQELERLDEAVENLRRALSLNSDYAQARNNLGNLLKMQGLFEESEACYRQALASNPANARCYNNLGVLLQESNRLEEAEVCLRQAIKLNPKFADGHNNLGQVFYKLGRLSEAITSYRRAIELRPSYALAHQNLGEVLMLKRKWEESLACYEHARSLNPNLDYLLAEIIYVRQQLCDWDALPENIEELVTRTNNNERVSLPFILQALVDCPETIQKGTEIFSKHNHPRSDVLPKIGIYQDHEKIRIGYFSPDFCKHPVTTGIADLFKLHDRENFEVHAFSFGPDIKDQWNTKVREGVDFYHDIRMMSDKGVASLSRSLEIDIAVDLTGHTKNNRTGIFAIGAALVQIGFMGFLGTMGASYYDYIFADTVVIPETQKDYYTEKIAYLPSCQVNSEQIDSPDTLYDRKHFGISEDSFVFCCFNQSVKITPDVFDSWSRILGQVKNSLLMLYVDNDIAAKNLRHQMSIRGVDPDRLIFGDRLSGSQYWSRYQVVDLFLDTFIYSAGMTASDALRMGCPMITKMGNSYASRLGASILSAVGLPELITITEAEYESLAIQLATHPEELKALKDKLLVNLSTQPLFDTQQFSHSIEEAYIAMYERSQSKKEPIDIYINKNATGFE